MATTESKSSVDAGSAGPFNVGKLIPSVLALVVKFKTVNHLPIMSEFNSGTALHCDSKLPATVDTFGTTEGVSVGKGPGPCPSCYTECNLPPSPTAFVDSDDTCKEHETSPNESCIPNFETSDKQRASVAIKRDTSDQESTDETELISFEGTLYTPTLVALGTGTLMSKDTSREESNKESNKTEGKADSTVYCVKDSSYSQEEPKEEGEDEDSSHEHANDDEDTEDSEDPEHEEDREEDKKRPSPQKTGKRRDTSRPFYTLVPSAPQLFVMADVVKAITFFLIAYSIWEMKLKSHVVIRKQHASFRFNVFKNRLLCPRFMG